MKILDLFCGVGGWSKGFHDIFPGAEIDGIDISEFSYPFNFIKKDLLDYTPEPVYDIVAASPPCSEFSEVKRNTAQRYDERIGLDLIFRTFYLMNYLKPKVWIIENVKGLSEFIDKPCEKIQYGLRCRKTAYLWSNKNIKLGFFNYDMSDYRSSIWHDPTISGWKAMKEGLRGQIPRQLSREIAKKVKMIINE